MVLGIPTRAVAAAEHTPRGWGAFVRICLFNSFDGQSLSAHSQYILLDPRGSFGKATGKLELLNTGPLLPGQIQGVSGLNIRTTQLYLEQEPLGLSHKPAGCLGRTCVFSSGHWTLTSTSAVCMEPSFSDSTKEECGNVGNKPLHRHPRTICHMKSGAGG